LSIPASHGIPLWAIPLGDQALEAKKHWAVQQKLADSERFHTTASWQKGGERSSGQGGFAVDMSEINRKSDSKDGDLM